MCWLLLFRSLLAVADPDFIDSNPFLYRVAFLLISLVISRFRYYFAWLLGKSSVAISNLLFFLYLYGPTLDWPLNLMYISFFVYNVVVLV